MLAITFPKGQTPPVRGFWSLTLYKRIAFCLNQTHSAAIAQAQKNKKLKYNPDGSLTLCASAS